MSVWLRIVAALVWTALCFAGTALWLLGSTLGDCFDLRCHEAQPNLTGSLLLVIAVWFIVSTLVLFGRGRGHRTSE